MSSPFPGMNPYLEQDDAWHSFHEHLVPRLADEIVAGTPARYFVKLDENIYLHELSADERRLLGRPDVAVVEAKRSADQTVAVSTSATAPMHAQLPAVDLERLSFIEIRDTRNRRLITAVELLSPANKRAGPDRDVYLAKRAKVIQQGVNYVEIDLLRGGPRMPMEGVPACDYLVMVARSTEWPNAGIWPISLRDRLPDIAIPLNPPDADVVVHLQQLLHATYDAGGYERFIYEGQPEPPFAH